MPVWLGIDTRKCLSRNTRSSCPTKICTCVTGTSQVKGTAAVSRVTVSADGRGVVSHAGMGLLRELADLTGFGADRAVLADT
jgi:hypothetical protein